MYEVEAINTIDFDSHALYFIEREGVWRSQNRNWLWEVTISKFQNFCASVNDLAAQPLCCS